MMRMSFRSVFLMFNDNSETAEVIHNFIRLWETNCITYGICDIFFQMRSGLEPTDSFSTQSNSLPAKRMLPTIMPEDTTRSERKLWTWFWTGFVNWPISAPDFRVS